MHDLTTEERSRLLELEHTLSARVVGQKHAVSQLATAVRLARSGLRDPQRPRGVFLFAGASGVGKIASQLPALLADAERLLGAMAEMARGGIRLDQASIARLAAEEARRGRSGRVALWVGALAISALAVMLALTST